MASQHQPEHIRQHILYTQEAELRLMFYIRLTRNNLDYYLYKSLPVTLFDCPLGRKERCPAGFCAIHTLCSVLFSIQTIQREERTEIRCTSIVLKSGTVDIQCMESYRAEAAIVGGR